MQSTRIAFLTALSLTTALAQNDISAFVDDFMGGLEHELKTELIVLRNTPKISTVPTFKLTEWNNGTDDPAVNETFVSNPELLQAHHVASAQQAKVARMKQNVTDARAVLHATRKSIAEMEIELASVSAKIIASEYMEKVTKKQGEQNIESSKVASEVKREKENLKEEVQMEKLVRSTKRLVGEKTEQYNEALHQVMMDAGAVLTQQQNVMHEKKTVLQETADRAELPELVDYVSDVTPGLAESAHNASAKQAKIDARMKQLQLEIAATKEEIRILEGGDAAATGGAATGAEEGATGAGR